MTYESVLAGPSKSVVVVYDFPDQTTRFVSRPVADLANPGGWTVFYGAEPQSDDGNELDLRRGRLTTGGASFRIPDVDEFVTAWVAANDGTLHRTRVSRLEGLEGVPEAEWHETRWLLDDVRGSGRKGGGYEFDLRNVLSDLSRGLYEDLGTESARLDDTTYPSGLAAAATTITLATSPKGEWREPGFAALWDDVAKNVEIVRYETIGGTGDLDLQSVTRHYYGVGAAAHVFLVEQCEIRQVWLKRGHPLDAMLEWLLSTDAAGASSPAQLLSNRDLDEWTASALDDWTTITAEGSTFTEETDPSIVKRGASCLKVTRGADSTPTDGIYREFATLVPGKWYALQVWIQNREGVIGGAPGFQPTFNLRNQTAGKFVTDAGAWTTGSGDTHWGVLGAGEWERFELQFQVDPTFGGGDTYRVTLGTRGGSGSTGFVAYFDRFDLVGPYDSAPAGVWDAGRDGIGLDPYFVDVDGIEEIREEVWGASPTFDAVTGVPTGVAFLYAEAKEIRDLKAWIEAHVLRPLGLFPITGADGRLGVETYFRAPASSLDLGDDWDSGQFNAGQWRRNYRDRVNNLQILTDWNPVDGEHETSRKLVQATSIARYGEAQADRIETRGARTGRIGFPDYALDAVLSDAANRILLDLANPPTAISVRAHFAHKDLALGEIVSLRIPHLPNLRTGARGLAGPEDQFLVTRRRLALDASEARAHVDLQLHLRRPVSRPAFVAPDGVAATYTGSSAADRQYCYLAPGTMFADSSEAYTVQAG